LFSENLFRAFRALDLWFSGEPRSAQAAGASEVFSLKELVFFYWPPKEGYNKRGQQKKTL